MVCAKIIRYRLKLSIEIRSLKYSFKLIGVSFPPQNNALGVGEILFCFIYIIFGIDGFQQNLVGCKIRI